MDLTDRKKRILRAVIESYIQNAEPVGSKAVAEWARLNVSSATIRNEMADLENLGYLEQPHTSAGRVPSPKGYRLYVNELMDFICEALQKRHPFYSKAKHLFKADELEDKRQIQASVDSLRKKLNK